MKYKGFGFSSKTLRSDFNVAKEILMSNDRVRYASMARELPDNTNKVRILIERILRGENVSLEGHELMKAIQEGFLPAKDVGLLWAFGGYNDFVVFLNEGGKVVAEQIYSAATYNNADAIRSIIAHGKSPRRDGTAPWDVPRIAEVIAQLEAEANK